MSVRPLPAPEVRESNGRVGGRRGPDGRAAGGEPARLTLLDGFALDCGPRSVHVSKTLQRLLAFVALRGRATRALVAGTLWPDSDESKAFGRLRTALWRLHRLGVPLLAAHGETLRLHPSVRVDVDELLAEDGSGRHPRGGALRELLPGWYDDWVLVERERLRQICLHTWEESAVRELRAGRFAEALEAVLVALRAEPLRESPHRLLLEIHLAEGNYSEAVYTYHAYRMLLHRELGVGPSPRMRRLLDAAVEPASGAGGPSPGERGEGPAR
ncbi:BTAD domain-containing putative transcriptional regulator [Kitasatospora sp. NPDC059327]|uniref:AfsR/SARP family transcriptional regulator n=1 Tax=Kitasatospora sp. NPDC059327 TaxID=3346803 RepID=UPI00368753C0